MTNVYPLHSNSNNSAVKIPTHTWNTEEFVREHNNLYIREEQKHHYRLCARNPHRMDDFLPYDIQCPHCGDTMKIIGGPKSYNELGLYVCKRCKKRD